MSSFCLLPTVLVSLVGLRQVQLVVASHTFRSRLRLLYTGDDKWIDITFDTDEDAKDALIYLAKCCGAPLEHVRKERKTDMKNNQ